MPSFAKYLLVGAGIVGLIFLAQRIFPGMPRGLFGDAEIPVRSSSPDQVDKSKQYPRAREIVAASGWVNSEPLAIADLIDQGYVVLIDFWTYSCINCQRTFPYLTAWDAKYRDQGLVILGVHTPEFEFEKDIENVRAAVEKFGITYPVVLDNDYGTWQAYRNQYWPRKYLIDVDGYIVYDHIGEGGYEETEQKIQELLAERAELRGTTLPTTAIGTPTDAVDVDYRSIGSPEMYLGAARNDGFLGNARTSTTGVQQLTMSDAGEQRQNLVYLGGQWEFSEESVTCVSDCVLRVQFTARQANVVADAAKLQYISISLDGQSQKTVSVDQPTLYTLFESVEYGDHTLELTIPSGIELFAFTFG